MTDPLKSSPAYAELRQLVSELSLISHALIQGYEFSPSDVGRGQRNRTSDYRPPIPHLGAHRPKSGDTKTPTGRDGEFKPRAPKAPRIEGDASSMKAWDAYEDELTAWLACYQRRTPEYFARRLARCATEQGLERLRDEARETLEAWRRTPIPSGQPPAMADPQWKRWIAESREDAGVLATRFGVTLRYINMIRTGYKEAA